MRHENPFKNMTTKNNNNDKTNTIKQNLPPKKESLKSNTNNDHNIYEENNSSTKYPQKKYINSPIQNYTPQNIFNFDNSQTDEEFEIIQNEYNAKLKPLNCSSDYISTSTNVFPTNGEILSQLSFPINISLCPMKNTGIDIPFIDYGDKACPFVSLKPDVSKLKEHTT